MRPTLILLSLLGAAACGAPGFAQPTSHIGEPLARVFIENNCSLSEAEASEGIRQRGMGVSDLRAQVKALLNGRFLQATPDGEWRLIDWPPCGAGAPVEIAADPMLQCSSPEGGVLTRLLSDYPYTPIGSVQVTTPTTGGIHRIDRRQLSENFSTFVGLSIAQQIPLLAALGQIENMAYCAATEDDAASASECVQEAPTPMVVWPFMEEHCPATCDPLSRAACFSRISYTIQSHAHSHGLLLSNHLSGYFSTEAIAWKNYWNGLQSGSRREIDTSWMEREFQEVDAIILLGYYFALVADDTANAIRRDLCDVHPWLEASQETLSGRNVVCDGLPSRDHYLQQLGHFWTHFRDSCLEHVGDDGPWCDVIDRGRTQMVSGTVPSLRIDPPGPAEQRPAGDEPVLPYEVIPETTPTMTEVETGEPQDRVRVPPPPIWVEGGAPVFLPNVAGNEPDANAEAVPETRLPQREMTAGVEEITVPRNVAIMLQSSGERYAERGVGSFGDDDAPDSLFAWSPRFSCAPRPERSGSQPRGAADTLRRLNTARQICNRLDDAREFLECGFQGDAVCTNASAIHLVCGILGPPGLLCEGAMLLTGFDRLLEGYAASGGNVNQMMLWAAEAGNPVTAITGIGRPPPYSEITAGLAARGIGPAEAATEQEIRSLGDRLRECQDSLRRNPCSWYDRILDRCGDCGVR